MPGRREPDSTVPHSFAFEVGGVTVTMLTEVSGLATERDVIELREGGADGGSVTRKPPGALRSGEVVLSRGLTGDRAFEQWMDEVSADAGAARRNAAVIVHDRQGQPIATFTLVRAWPRRLEYTGLRSGGTEPLTERLVLVHEGFDRV